MRRFLAFTVLWLLASVGMADATYYPPFQVLGGTTPTSMQGFGDRSLSILDFGATPDCSTDATTALVAAETAALAQGVHTIRFDMNTVGNCFKIGTHTVPTGIQLWCPGPVAGPPAGNDFRLITRIALSTTAGVTFSSGSGEKNCNFVQNAIANAAPPVDFQGNYTRATSFTGTGITVAGDNVDIDGGYLIGFTSAVTTKNSRLATIRNLYLDGTTCMTLANQGGGGEIIADNINCAPYANKFGGAPVQEPNFPLSSITDNSSGVLQVHLTSSCTGTGCVLNGYKVWINGGGNASVQSAQGEWIAANVTSTTVDLQGSSSAFIGGQVETGVTTTTGSVVVSGLLTNVQQVEPTQTVTGTCIPAGATIVAVERPYGVIWLDSTHAATSSGSCNITITDAAPTSVSISAVAIGNSGGSGYAQGDVISPATGTGTAATFSVDAVDGSGAVTALSVIDGGTYTVAPSPLLNAATVGGAGTGLTINISVSAALYGSADYRSGPGFSLLKAPALQLSNIGELSHATGIMFGFNAHSSNIVNCSLHDENILQAQNHIGINFTSNSNANVLTNCNSFYFGAAVALHNSAGAQLGTNTVQGSVLGGSSGNSGLQNTILDVASYDSSGNPQPGVASNSGIALVDDTSQVFGALTIMGDARNINLDGTTMSSASLYCQNDTASSTVTGTAVFRASTSNCNSFSTSPASTAARIQPATTATLLLTNNNCGNAIVSAAAGGTLPTILPNPPITGCEISFRPNTNAITINPNGNTIGTNLINQSSTLTLAAETNGFVTLRYDPTALRWRVSSCAPSTCTINNLLFGQNVSHGQVYMSCKGTCSGGTGQLQLCPYNGPGGLIMGGALYQIPACTYLDNSVFSAVTSALRYIYAFTNTQGVTAMADNGSGKTRLTINSSAGFNTGDPIICANATGTTGINTATYDNNTTLIDATHIDVTDVNFVATGIANCSWIGFAISAAGHVTDANGVEIQSGNAFRTLVGMVWVDASHNINSTATKRDVASFFNRQQNKCISGYSTNRTTASASLTELNAESECEFVSWGPPATPALPIPITPWALTVMGSNGTASDGWNVTAGFDSTSVGETEVGGSNNGATVQLSASPNGIKTGLAEGKHFITILGNAVTGGTTTFYSAASSVEANPWQ